MDAYASFRSFLCIHVLLADLLTQHNLVITEFGRSNVLHPAADLRNLPALEFVGWNFPAAKRTEVMYLRPIVEQVGTWDGLCCNSHAL